MSLVMQARHTLSQVYSLSVFAHLRFENKNQNSDFVRVKEQHRFLGKVLIAVVVVSRRTKHLKYELIL